MPCQKELDADKKLTDRGPCDKSSQWLVMLKGETEWKDCTGDTAFSALESIGKSFADIKDMKPGV